MKKFLTGLLAVATITLSGLASTAPAYADAATDAAKQQVCQGVSAGGGTCGASSDSLTKTVTAILNVLSIIAGVAGVIMIIVSGLRYITSGGDAQSVSGAKRTLIYAIVGLVVVAFAQFIVRFVLGNT